MNKATDYEQSYTMKVKTPDGTMFIHIIGNGKPSRMMISIGKSGSSIQAWAESVASLVTMCLEKEVPIGAIMNVLNEITTDRIAYSFGLPVKSGPDGVAHALMLYANKDKVKYVSPNRWRPPTIGGEEVW